MSTRGTFGFRVNGKDFLSYNHSDSYPSGLGTEFVAEVRELVKDPNIKERFAKVKLVGGEGSPAPTPEDIEALKPYTNLGVSTGKTDEWYCLLRGAQGSLALALESGYLMDYSPFILRSLFCEYAYIWNLDDGTVEFYEGFVARKPGDGHKRHGTEGKPGAGRYSALAPEVNTREDGSTYPNDYWGCALVATFPANEIPEDWEAKAYPQEEDED
jgi:hypothetical protein